MFKRTDKDDNNYSAVPTKRLKLDGSRSSYSGARSKSDSSSKQNVRFEDVWGDDFAEEEIEKMDFVASQACLHDDNIFIESKGKQNALVTKENLPSTSKQIFYSTNTENPISQVKTFTQGDDYTDFEKKLLYKQNYNSTFQLNRNITVSDNNEHKDLEKELNKLKLERNKLLNDFIMKDGETVFLRNQLQQTQVRAENDKVEKMHLIEEQAKQHRTEINQIFKEKEDLKTQLDLQALEIEKLLERCKLLESGHIKLVEPHTANTMSPNINRKINIKSHSSSSTKCTRKKDADTQVSNLYHRNSHFLRTLIFHYPLLKVPSQSFEPALPEKSLVEIQITEKIGKQNLLILQEEQTFRIFENPDLVKPVITTINGRKLSLEFVLSDLATIKNKASSELDSDACIPIINKLVSTSRELIINTIIVLRTIFHAMKNDDIRDMNDLYFSDVYKTPIFYTKSTCDANAWHENEHGIEARRIFGILSHIASESFYLSNYIAGQTSLLVNEDTSYEEYSKYMIRYNSWDKRGLDFEMLEMILQLVSSIGLVRRSHQFSGLISAIAELLCNVSKKVGYCDSGIDFVFEIFKELVFSRPLSLCYVPLTKMMTTLINYNTFLENICTDPHNMAEKIWEDPLRFTSDACILQIFIRQIENVDFDLITTINITHSLLSFIQTALHTNALLVKTGNSCNCCMKLLRLIIKMLCRCSEVSLGKLQFENDLCISNDDFLPMNIDYNFTERLNKQYIHCTELKKYGIKEYMKQMYPKDRSDKNYWINIKRKQLTTMRDGIKFLRHLATCDPDFMIRLSDIEDSFHLFMNNISTFDNLILHENEREAISLIKSTFIFDKTLLPEGQTNKNKVSLNELSIATNFRKEFSDFASQEMVRKNSNIEDCHNIFVAYKSLYSNKSKQY
ncbi:hypothetical protein V1477_017582 [Vespula maculifrons]|uniref:ATR-interacting protein mus304 n=1 Tax=Vespula maculifrons TaxID=7453 RepID=A0ABD2B6F1_VESMC